MAKKLTTKQKKMVSEILACGNIAEGCRKAKSTRQYFYKLLRSNDLFKKTYEDSLAGIENIYKKHLRLLAEKSISTLEDALDDEKERVKVALAIITNNLRLDELDILKRLETLEAEYEN